MKLDTNIKGIFLDIGWTLWAPVNGKWMLTNEFFSRINSQEFDNLPSERIDNIMKSSIKFLDDNHLILSEEEEAAQMLTFYQMLCDALPELGLTKKDVAAIAHDKVYNMDNYYVYEDSIEAVKELHKNYKLGILSDNWPSCKRALKHFGIMDYFSAITISSYLNIFKPHPQMYLDALKKIDLPPEQTVFVDDGIENLRGAQKHGIQSVLITREKELQNLYKGQVEFLQIDSLQELLQKLTVCEK